MKPSMKLAYVIAVLSVLFATGMGVTFGVLEGEIKQYVHDGVAANAELLQLEPAAQAKAQQKLRSKSWRYIQRAHFHGGGIAALTIGLLLILGQLACSEKTRRSLALTLSISGAIYPFFWLCAGLAAPTIGTSAAKAQSEWLAYFGALHLVATVGIVFVLCREKCQK